MIVPGSEEIKGLLGSGGIALLFFGSEGRFGVFSPSTGHWPKFQRPSTETFHLTSGPDQVRQSVLFASVYVSKRNGSHIVLSVCIKDVFAIHNTSREESKLGGSQLSWIEPNLGAWITTRIVSLLDRKESNAKRSQKSTNQSLEDRNLLDREESNLWSQRGSARLNSISLDHYFMWIGSFEFALFDREESESTK